MKKSVFLAMMLPFLAVSASANAIGHDHGNGGDSLVMKFKMAGQKVCDHLKASPDNKAFTAAAFCEAVAKAQVTSQDKTFLADGTEVDAINIPSKFVIKLSQDRNFSKSFRDLVHLAAHEYISVIGVDDKNYQISGPIAVRIGDVVEPSLPTGPCLQIKAEYKCEDSEDRVAGITSQGNVFKLENLAPYAEKPFIADGVERRVSYSPPGPDRDVAYEAFLTARCTAAGLEIKTFNNDFMPLDPNTGKYSASGYTNSLHLFTVSRDLSQLVWESKYIRVNTEKGTSSENRQKIRCIKIK